MAGNTDKKARRPVGRPSKYSEELAVKICSMIASGKSLKSICEESGMPHRDTVREWLLQNAEFSAKYARAREEQADLFADEIVEIADAVFADSAEVAKAKLQIDARKWKASKMLPKKYGDKLEVDNKSSDGSMTPKAALSAEEVKAALASAIGKVV